MATYVQKTNGVFDQNGNQVAPLISGVNDALFEAFLLNPNDIIVETPENYPQTIKSWQARAVLDAHGWLIHVDAWIEQFKNSEDAAIKASYYKFIDEGEWRLDSLEIQAALQYFGQTGLSVYGLYDWTPELVQQWFNEAAAL